MSKSGFIYAIGIDGMSVVKIGQTGGSVKKRLDDLQIGHPGVLKVVASVYVEQHLTAIERAVHRFLDTYHQRGEWFAIAMDQEQLETLTMQAITCVESMPQGREKVPDLSMFQGRVRAARQRAHLTQEALAALMGCHKADVSKMERGKMVPTAPRLRHLSISLNVSADFLLGLVEEMDCYYYGIEDNAGVVPAELHSSPLDGLAEG